MTEKIQIKGICNEMFKQILPMVYVVNNTCMANELECCIGSRSSLLNWNYEIAESYQLKHYLNYDQ